MRRFLAAVIVGLALSEAASAQQPDQQQIIAQQNVVIGYLQRQNDEKAIAIRVAEIRIAELEKKLSEKPKDEPKK